MKKIIFSAFLLAGLFLNVSAQNKLKKHHCTEACANGKHMYAHGEKGHVCGDDCKKMNHSAGMGLKEHVCTAACAGGKHVYAHGEKGHVCTDACKKSM